MAVNISPYIQLPFISVLEMYLSASWIISKVTTGYPAMSK